MANNELLAKIKAEIERRKKSLRAGICNEEVFTRKQREEMLVASEELGRFNRFLSTLESEKPMQEGLEEEIDACWQSWLSPSNQKEVEGVLPKTEFAMYARHFAQWGAEHLANSNDEVVINGHKVEYDKDKDAITMEAIPNDLEEAARKHSCYDEDCEGAWYEPIVRNAFIAGAKWGRQQMMEEAVDGYVVKDITGSLAVTAKGINLDGFKFGDKVRVLIIKE